MAAKKTYTVGKGPLIASGGALLTLATVLTVLWVLGDIQWGPIYDNTARCAGTPQNPCEFNVTVCGTHGNVSITGTKKLSPDFSADIKTYQMRARIGKGSWKKISNATNFTAASILIPDCAISNLTINVKALKHRVTDDIKWTIGTIDPDWAGYETKDFYSNFADMQTTPVQCLSDCEARPILKNALPYRATYPAKDLLAHFRGQLDEVNLYQETKHNITETIRSYQCTTITTRLNGSASTEMCTNNAIGNNTRTITELKSITSDITLAPNETIQLVIKGKRPAQLGTRRAEWLLNFSVENTTIELDPFFDGNWSSCWNITFEEKRNINRTNETILITPSNLACQADNDDLRIVNTHCNNGGTEIPRDIIIASATAPSIGFYADVNNLTNKTYALYCNNSAATAPSYTDEITNNSYSDSNNAGPRINGTAYGGMVVDIEVNAGTYNMGGVSAIWLGTNRLTSVNAQYPIFYPNGDGTTTCTFNTGGNLFFWGNCSRSLGPGNFSFFANSRKAVMLTRFANQGDTQKLLMGRCLAEQISEENNDSNNFAYGANCSGIDATVWYQSNNTPLESDVGNSDAWRDSGGNGINTNPSWNCLGTAVKSQGIAGYNASALACGHPLNGTFAQSAVIHQDSAAVPAIPNITLLIPSQTNFTQYETVRFNITCIDNESTSLNISGAWFVNSVSRYTFNLTGITNNTLTQVNLTNGNYSATNSTNLFANCTDGNGNISATINNSVLIAAYPPVPVIVLNQSAYNVTDTIQANVSCNDPQSVADDIFIRWRVNDNPVYNQTFTAVPNATILFVNLTAAGNFTYGDLVNITVNCTDVLGISSTQDQSQITTIMRGDISSVNITAPPNGTSYGNGTTFTLNFNITCTGDTGCGTIKTYIQVANTTGLLNLRNITATGSATGFNVSAVPCLTITATSAGMYNASCLISIGADVPGIPFYFQPVANKSVNNTLVAGNLVNITVNNMTINAAPNATAPVYNQTNYTKDQTVQINTSCIDNESTLLNLSVNFYANGAQKYSINLSAVANNTLTQINLTPTGNFTNGDSINARVNCTDADGSTSTTLNNSVLIINRPPVANNITLNQSSGYLNASTIQANVSCHDSDGDTCNLTVLFYTNGNHVYNITLPDVANASIKQVNLTGPGNFTAGDNVTIYLNVTDALGAFSSAHSNISTTILPLSNTTPTQTWFNITFPLTCNGSISCLYALEFGGLKRPGIGITGFPHIPDGNTTPVKQASAAVDRASVFTCPSSCQNAKASFGLLEYPPIRIGNYSILFRVMNFTAALNASIKLRINDTQLALNRTVNDTINLSTFRLYAYKNGKVQPYNSTMNETPFKVEP